MGRYGEVLGGVLYGRHPERFRGLFTVTPSWHENPGLGVGRAQGQRLELQLSEPHESRGGDPAPETKPDAPAGGAGHALRHSGARLSQQHRQHHAPVVGQGPQ